MTYVVHDTGRRNWDLKLANCPPPRLTFNDMAEDPFALIEEGNRLEEEGKFWEAAEAFGRAFLALDELSSATRSKASEQRAVCTTSDNKDDFRKRIKKAVENGDKVKDASAQLVSAPWTVNGGGLEAFLDVEEVFGVLAQHEGFRSAVAREFDDIEQSGVEATLLGYIFGAGNNSNGDLANAHRDVSRVSGSFHALDEVCIPEEAQPDEAVAFVPLEA